MQKISGFQETTIYFFVILTLCLAGSAAAATADLTNYRGINLTLRSNPTSEDINKIAGWGVNVVRLVIHTDPKRKNNDGFYLADGKTLDDKAFTKLDNVIKMLAERNIKVIIDMHSFPGHEGGIWEDFKYWDQFEKLWSNIAARYQKNPAVIGYDLMNEPSLVLTQGTSLDRKSMQLGYWAFPKKWLNTPRDYYLLVEKTGQTINRIDPSKVVIVEGVGLWGHPNNFLWMRPVNIRNVVYSFHMYVPHKFSDMGKTESVRTGSRYDKGMRTQVLKALEPVKIFAKKHNAQIFVGELGLSYYSEGQGASEWLRDVLDYCEQNGWSWAYWTYSIPFRNPEITLLKDGTLKARHDTERLTVLKSYWGKNRQPKTVQ